MQRTQALFGVLLVALPFAFVACGDDNADDGGGNATGGKGGTAGSATGGKGGMTTGGKGGASGTSGMSGASGTNAGGRGGTGTGGVGGPEGGQGGAPEGGEGGEAGTQGGTGGMPMGGAGGAIAGGGAGGKAGGGAGGAMAGGGAGGKAGGGAGGGIAGGGAGGKAGGGAGGAIAGGGAGGAGMGGMAGTGGAAPTCDPTPPPEIYVGVLSGAQEVPPITTTATGVVIAQLNAAATELTSSVIWSGLGSVTTIGHIHGPAVAGAGPAPVIFDYAPTPGATSGQVIAKTFAINATQLGYLRTAMLYANIHSMTNGGGEIRAQLLPATVVRSGTLSAAQETTAVTSTATGRAVVVVLPNNTQAFVSVSWSGLTTNTYLGHIHGPAAAGATASPMFDLMPLLTAMSGSVVQKLWDMTTPQHDALLANLTYANIHSNMYMGGEIRAQLLPRCP